MAYYLTGSSVLWHLVTQIIVDLSMVKIVVCAVVRDMGRSNRAMWHAAGIIAWKEEVVNSTEHPAASGQMLHILPDVPHVLKNVHNCLLAQDIFCYYLMLCSINCQGLCFCFFMWGLCLICRSPQNIKLHLHCVGSMLSQNSSKKLRSTLRTTV